MAFDPIHGSSIVIWYLVKWTYKESKINLLPSLLVINQLYLQPIVSHDTLKIILSIYLGESKVLQYFSSTWGTIQQLSILFSRRRQTTLDYVIPSSPDTLRMLLTGFTSLAWSPLKLLLTQQQQKPTDLRSSHSD